MRNNAIEESVKLLTQTILEAASGVHQPSHFTNWRMVGKGVLVIADVLLKARIYGKSTDGSTKSFPEIIPSVIERLRIIFPDVDFRQDELGSYLIVDWS
jgi:hypothetical protein